MQEQSIHPLFHEYGIANTVSPQRVSRQLHAARVPDTRDFEFNGSHLLLR
jgi:hypothetical protein